MTFEAVKEKLHQYLDRAGEEKVMAIYTLVSSEIERDTIYDEDTLNLIMKRREDVMAGKVKTYTLDESKERIRQFRDRNGL